MVGSGLVIRGRGWNPYLGEPLDAFREFGRELGPVDGSGRVTVVHGSDLDCLMAPVSFSRR